MPSLTVFVATVSAPLFKFWIGFPKRPNAVGAIKLAGKEKIDESDDRKSPNAVQGGPLLVIDGDELEPQVMTLLATDRGPPCNFICRRNAEGNIFGLSFRRYKSNKKSSRSKLLNFQMRIARHLLRVFYTLYIPGHSMHGVFTCIYSHFPHVGVCISICTINL